MSFGRIVVLVVALSIVSTKSTQAAVDLLLNGNFDATHSVEFDPLRYPEQTNEYPDHWEMDSDFNVPSPFLDGFTAELWAGGPNSPDTGPEDRGIFFKSFYGGAPFPGDLNPTITTHMTQDVPGVVGSTYTLKGWAAAESNYSGFLLAGGQTFFALEFLNGGGGVISSVELDLEASGLAVNPRDATIESPWNWQEYVLVGVAPAGTAEVRTRVSVVDGFYSFDPGQAFIVDDFSLDVTPVPEAGTALMAVMGMGLVAMARRRRGVVS
jgi:hypothetical protein